MKMTRFIALFDRTESGLEKFASKCKPTLNGERYITDKELCGRLRVSDRTTQEWRTTGKIAYVQFEGKGKVVEQKQNPWFIGIAIALLAIFSLLMSVSSLDEEEYMQDEYGYESYHPNNSQYKLLQDDMFYYSYKSDVKIYRQDPPGINPVLIASGQISDCMTEYQYDKFSSGEMTNYEEVVISYLQSL